MSTPRIPPILLTSLVALGHAPSVRRPRDAAPRRTRLRSVANRLSALAAAVVLPVVAAQQAPAVVPTVASVQEAEPVPFRPAPGTDLSRVRGVGVIAESALSVAWFDARDGLLWVAFRLAGQRSVDVDRLTVATSDGSVHDVAVGSVAIRPAADPDAPLAAISELVESAPPPSDRTAAWLFQNRSDETVRVATVAYAPSGAGRGVVLARTFGAPDPREAFDAWVRTVEDVAAVAWAAAEARSPQALEAALRRSFAGDLHGVDEVGSFAGIELAPGQSMGLVVTSAAFAASVGDATLFIDPAITTVSENGTRRVAFSAGPTVRLRVP